MPGSMPPTRQLEWLSSTTAMIVLFWSRAMRDLLKSFGWGIAGTPSIRYSDEVAIPRRPPHSVSPLEGTGFEPSVPRQEKWSMPSSSDQTRGGRTLTLGGGAESSPWRAETSNSRFRRKTSVLRPMISARTARIDDNLGRGTDDSNPLPSRAESANHRFLSSRQAITCAGTYQRLQGRRVGQPGTCIYFGLSRRAAVLDH